CVLVGEGFHRLRRWPDEIGIAAPADLVEMRVLRKKAVTRMDRLDVAHLGGADDLVDLQVALPSARRADADRLVGQLQILAPRVSLAIDADRLDPQRLAGADHAKSDFAAVGNEDAFEHNK